jgi:4-hydroxy-3-methylbut-2-enyl diphosphate reductase
VLNLEEANYVSEYILGRGNKNHFLNKFAQAFSNGFDPDKDLDRVGVANQTTMLKSETEEIGKVFEKTMLHKFGPEKLNSHFLAFNTICDATEERQDAMFSLVDEDLDILVVIGGYNSSNTTHLQEIAINKNISSFHIDTPERISVKENSIHHKPLKSEMVLKKNFIPEGEIKVGITSGASTPDKIVADVIEKLIAITK